MLTVTYAECHTKAPNAECHYAEFHGADFYHSVNTPKRLIDIYKILSWKCVRLHVVNMAHIFALTTLVNVTQI